SWPYRLYVLPVLFAVWVNVDGWFVLGPITVALYWLGEALQEAFAPVPSGPDAPEPRERKQLLLVLGLGLAACLLNPFHVHAFVVPGELSPAIADEIKIDPLYRRMFWTPWSGDYLARKDLRFNVAEMAYYPLLVLGLASFAVNLAGWRWWRALVWVAFALLGACHVRSIPFFAVVGGPIMALNIQDALIRRFQNRRTMPYAPSIWSLAGRAASVLLLVIAVAAAWPGWLHGLPGESSAEARRVGWGLNTDPALVETAERLAQWRREGKITGEQNAFNLHPDVANYLAFYCPEEKAFFDYRFPLYKNSVATYLKLRGDFKPGGGDADWQTVFRERNIKHLIVYYDQDPVRVLPTIERLEEDKFLPEKERQWTLIDLHGRVALYAWSDPAKGWNEGKTDRAREEIVRAQEIQPDQRAFGPAAETAPGTRRGEGPQGRDSIWAQYTMPVGNRTADSYEAMFHWFMSHVEADQAGRAAGSDHALLVAKAIGLGVAPQTMPDKLYFAVYPMRAALYGPGGKFRSPASTLLAIRAARRALAANPDDDSAYKFLSLSYQLLPENIGDLFNSQSLLGEIRKCQIGGALYNAAKLAPDRPEIQEQLARFYAAQNFQDLAVKHFKEYVRLTEETGSRPGERVEDYRDRLRALRDQAKKWEDGVKQAQNQYLIASKPFSNVLAKVEQALRRDRGLAGEALDLLLKAKPEELGAVGEFMELHLLLQVGRVEEWPEGLRDAGPESTLGTLPILRAAAVGDYDRADELIAKLIPLRREQYLASLPPWLASQVAPLWLEFFDPTGMKPLGWQITQRFFNIPRLQPLQRITPVPQDEGELSVVRGLLALEAGNNRRAAEQFRYAITVSIPPARYAPYFAVLGASSPFGAAATYLGSGQLAIGPLVPVPSLRWAIEYAKLLEQAGM
ncbi:MAG TPA: hypothetical protein VGG61_12390, partial [Gemmataceae bacterium]